MIQNIDEIIIIYRTLLLKTIWEDHA